MVWWNEGEVDGLARVCAKRWRSGIELIASYRKVEGVVRREVFVYVAKRNSWSRLAKGLGEVY